MQAAGVLAHQIDNAGHSAQDLAVLGGADFLLLQAENSVGLDEANRAAELDFLARLKADQEAADRASAEQETGLAQGASTGEDKFHHVAPKEDNNAAGARRSQRGLNSPLGNGSRGRTDVAMSRTRTPKVGASARGDSSKGAASPLRKAK